MVGFCCFLISLPFFFANWTDNVVLTCFPSTAMNFDLMYHLLSIDSRKLQLQYLQLLVVWLILLCRWFWYIVSVLLLELQVEVLLVSPWHLNPSISCATSTLCVFSTWRAGDKFPTSSHVFIMVANAWVIDWIMTYFPLPKKLSWSFAAKALEIIICSTLVQLVRNRSFL